MPRKHFKNPYKIKPKGGKLLFFSITIDINRSLSLSKWKGPQAQTDISEFHWFSPLFKFECIVRWIRFIILYHHEKYYNNM